MSFWVSVSFSDNFLSVTISPIDSICHAQFVAQPFGAQLALNNLQQ
jgi:hypothetical protein